jgi:hypothetical protein
MKFLINKYLFILIFLFAGQFAQAQETIQSGQIDIVKNYKPSLEIAKKIQLKATLPPADTIHPVVTYSPGIKLLNVPFVPAPIKPLGMPKDERDTGFNDLIKIGIGTQLTPLVDASFHSGESDDHDIGLHICHLSSRGNLSYQSFSDNDVKLSADKFFDQSVLSGNAEFSRNAINFYGYNHADTSFTTDQEKQYYQYFGLGGEFKNARNTDSRWNYSVSVHGYNYQDYLGSSQYHVSAALHLDKTFADIHQIGLNVNENYYTAKDTFNASKNYFTINPYYHVNGNIFTLKLGASGTFTDSSLYIYPDLSIDISITPDVVIFYAGWNGQVIQNSFRSLSQYNPFLIENFLTQPTRENHIYAGLRGAFLHHFTYRMELRNDLEKDFATYLPDSTDNRKFDVVYYPNEITLGFHGEIAYMQTERFNILLEGDFNQYSIKDEKAWGIPANKITLSADYNILNKIIFRADVFDYSSSWTRLPDSTAAVSMGGTVDANFSVTYNFKQNFLFFLNLNNVAAQHYQRWYNYPGYGFQALIGAGLKF